MLRAAWDVSRSASDLKEAIGLYEQILQLRPLGHALRAKSITDLGDALFWSCLDREVVEDQGDRCLRLFREALELRLPGHDLRGQSLLNLARALFYIGFDQRGELETLTECVHVARQILHLRPAVSQLERVSSLNVLAGALMSLYEQHGGPEVLSEAAMVLRECLDLCPPEDPKRSRILTNNGLVMTATFELHGDMAALADAVSMHRKAVHVCPPGDAFRDYCLNNLAEVLKISFDSQGGLESLAETIAVHREVLQLRPLGHPLRHYSLTNLAGALSADASYRGHSDSSSEIVSLYREALSLLPVTHAERTRPMDGVAEYLLDAFRERGSQDALDEAIGLLREVLSLKPPGHLSRCASSITLARALRARFNARFDAHALSEAVALLREALLLHPRGHPQRLLAMEELADILHCTADYQSWNECLALYRQALEECPSGYPARTRLLCGMSRCFLDPKSPYFDLVTGVSHLSAGYADNSSHVSQRLRHAVSDLCRVETAFQMARKGFPTEYLSHYNGHVLDLYAQVIGLLPRAANFGINHKTRLQAVTGTDQISRNAAAHSLQIGRLPQAVEMLEEGRGVFWSQTLYLRATEFDRLPDHDRQELTHLLRNLESSANRVESSDQTAAQRERDLENHRRQNDEAEALIRKIRGYPGLDRFLLPPAFKSLFDALPDGFVAILNMSTLGHHALLLHRARGLAASLELEPPPAGFDSERMRAQIPRDIRAEAISEEAPMRAMRLDSGRYGSFQGVLADLWTSIGWPVVSKLGLQVRHVDCGWS
jgi:tetratricopeptide (TPR) repeat protein